MTTAVRPLNQKLDVALFCLKQEPGTNYAAGELDVKHSIVLNCQPPVDWLVRGIYPIP